MDLWLVAVSDYGIVVVVARDCRQELGGRLTLYFENKICIGQRRATRGLGLINVRSVPIVLGGNNVMAVDDRRKKEEGSRRVG